MGADTARLKRMLEIRSWLLGVKVCAFCDLARALWQTEREMGDRSWEPHSYRCKATDFNGRTCEAKIDECWPELAEATLWARTGEMIAKALTSESASSNVVARSGPGSAGSTRSRSEASATRTASRFGSRSSPVGK